MGLDGQLAGVVDTGVVSFFLGLAVLNRIRVSHPVGSHCRRQPVQHFDVGHHGPQLTQYLVGGLRDDVLAAFSDGTQLHLHADVDEVLVEQNLQCASLVTDLVETTEAVRVDVVGAEELGELQGFLIRLIEILASISCPELRRHVGKRHEERLGHVGQVVRRAGQQEHERVGRHQLVLNRRVLIVHRGQMSAHDFIRQTGLPILGVARALLGGVTDDLQCGFRFRVGLQLSDKRRLGFPLGDERTHHVGIVTLHTTALHLGLVGVGTVELGDVHLAGGRGERVPLFLVQAGVGGNLLFQLLQNGEVERLHLDIFVLERLLDPRHLRVGRSHFIPPFDGFVVTVDELDEVVILVFFHLFQELAGTTAVVVDALLFSHVLSRLTDNSPVTETLQRGVGLAEHGVPLDVLLGVADVGVDGLIEPLLLVSTELEHLTNHRLSFLGELVELLGDRRIGSVLVAFDGDVVAPLAFGGGEFDELVDLGLLGLRQSVVRVGDLGDNLFALVPFHLPTTGGLEELVSPRDVLLDLLRQAMPEHQGVLDRLELVPQQLDDTAD